MARGSGKNTEAPKPPLELKVSREDAKSRLEGRIELGRELRDRQIQSQGQIEAARHEYSKWDSFNSELLRRLFTSDEPVAEYDFWGAVFTSGREESLGERIADFRRGVEEKLHRIDSIINRLELIPLMAAAEVVPHAPQSRAAAQAVSKKVFVVHGHDELAKTNLEVFLRENGLEPIVLHRQPDQGLTIIEKFEKYSDVGYAFILLTPDEVAYLRADEQKPDTERRKERRARPNVIFEFGYFVGKLGRSRVCCLHTGDVQLPTDVSGLIYKSYDKNLDEVAYSIIKDLRAAGYPI